MAIVQLYNNIFIGYFSTNLKLKDIVQFRDSNINVVVQLFN